MKELFDRHQAKLTDAEDRRIWGAMHEASRPRRRWTRWGLPAFVTTAAAAAIVVTMVHQDSVRNAARKNLPEVRVQTPPVPMVATNEATEGRTDRTPETSDQAEAAETVPAARDRHMLPPQSEPNLAQETDGKVAAATESATPSIAASEAVPAAPRMAVPEEAPTPMAVAAEKSAPAKIKAQVQGGTIRGRVTAKDGTPLVYANVVLAGTHLGAMTDTTGAFVIEGLPKGHYTMQVSYLGYASVERELAVTEGATETLDFAMNEGDPTIMDPVVVEAKKESIRKTQSSTPHKLSAEDLNKMSPKDKAEAEALRGGIIQQGGLDAVSGGRNDQGQSQDEPRGQAKKSPKGGTSYLVAPRTAEKAPLTGEEAAQTNLSLPPETRLPVDYRNTIGQKLPPGPPIPVGGSAPVNGQVVDAMFFEHYGVNPFVDPEDDRFATFAVDVDNASFSLARAYLLDQNLLPPKDAIRVEEFVNAFDHHYAPPQGDVASRDWGASEHGTFAIHLEASPSPFGKDLVLMRVGLKGREISERDRKPAALTFVVDVSGSMGREDRLGLVKRSLRLLLDRLDEQDDVSLVVYGTGARVILQPTSVDRRRTIEDAIDRLVPEGATNAEDGLRTAYSLAERNFRKGATNRVILCSDGVANVGRTGAEDILREIKRCAGEGIYLTTIGFGMGNYNDVLMEKLADQGDGNYYYVDTLDEARKVFVEHLTGTLEVIARQTKIQVEFDPETVRRYRLIGYENRDVADRDFRNDKVDAGEVGAGHEVTALFEVKLNRTRHDQVATVRIRYEDPETHRVTEEARSLDTRDIAGRFEQTDASFRMDAAVAEFAEILRHSYWAKDGNLARVYGVARDAAREMPRANEVQDLVQMVEKASRLWPRETPPEWRDDVRPLWEPENR